MRIIFTIIGVVFICGWSNAQDTLAFQKEQNALHVKEVNRFHINQDDRFGQFSLSNEGAALQQMIFSPLGSRLGFKTNAYQSYLRDKSNFQFSRYDRFTKLSYMTANDEGQYISAYHSQQFKNFSFALDYSKILSEGFFINQKARHANTSLMLKYQPGNKKYSAKVFAMYNTISARENGGLASDSLYLDEAFNNEKVYPVRLSDAQIEQWNISLNLEQVYDLRTENPFSNYSYLKLSSNYESQEELYTDGDPDFQANVEGVEVDNYYPSISDNNQTHDSIGFQTFGHHLSWNYGIKALLDARLSYGFQWDNFTTGIIRENQDRQRFELDLDVLKSLLKFNLKSEQSNLFDSGRTSWSLASQIVKDFELGYKSQSLYPELFMRSYIGNHLYWINDFSNQKVQTFYSFIKDDKRKFKFQVDYLLLDDWIFYNSEARPEQISDRQELVQVSLRKAVSVKKWNANLRLVWQKTDSEILRIPEWLTRVQLYYQDIIFGKNEFQLGAQVNYFSKFNAPSYMAATSVFYLGEDKEVGDYPMVDIFFNIRVKSLKAFLKFENINGLFGEREDMFVAPHYTLPEPRFKFGLTWNFYDK